jgi:phenylalanyl-tRNA synthetase alpha chain
MSLTTLVEKLEKVSAEAIAAIGQAKTLKDVEDLRVRFLGKKSELTEIFSQFGKLSSDERPKAGQVGNEVRTKITQLLSEKQESFGSAELNAKLKSEQVDVTLPGRLRPNASLHPVTLVRQELARIFGNIGFTVEEGPEIEHEFYNFDALNIPPNHPSRALQDTFYIQNRKDLVLRTHTSPVQIRTMLSQKPPIRTISPGRVYRADYDATHSPMFHQIEGLLVDKKVSMSELKGVLSFMVKEFFGAELKVRLRPSFFPFTEPSAEVDMECRFCKGAGCKTCKGTGWVEIGGCGMIDPEVMKAVNLDPEEYRGFAFGMGLERMAMLKFGINDLRAFFESDQRFIEQFSRWSR